MKVKRTLIQAAALPGLFALVFVLLDSYLERLAHGSDVHVAVHFTFIVAGGVIVFLTTFWTLRSYNRAEALVRQSRDALESRVRDRTQELERANQQLQAEVAERRAAEEALRTSEAKFSAVFRGSPDAIGIFRVGDGALLDVNDAFLRLVCYERSEVLGNRWQELGRFQAAEGVAEIGRMLSEQGFVADYEFDLGTGQGERVTVLLSLTPMVVNDEACIAAIAHDVTAWRRSQIALQQAQAALAESIRERTAQEERQRLARELHDSVSQAFYGISLGANTALKLFDSDRDKVLAALHYVLTLAETGLVEMRALIFELRPESLERDGLVAGLSHLVSAFGARHGVEVAATLCGEPEADLPVKEVVYRIAQVALNNAAKHADADRLELSLDCDPGGLALVVADDGVGFDPSASYPGHLGLRSMRERAVEVGGTVEIVSAPGAGTRVSARVPADGVCVEETGEAAGVAS